MEDSFFGFNTSAPVENDRRGGRRNDDEEEDEYDALNDETFGAATNGDWENIHEKLVELDEFHVSSDCKDDDNESDLEINLSGVKLDDVDIGSDDNEFRIQLDPRVWAMSQKPEVQDSISNNGFTNSETFLRQHMRHPFDNFQKHSLPPQQTLQQQQQQQLQQQQHQQHIQQQNRFFGITTPPATGTPKICTVEDIERNIRNQQLRSSSSSKPSTPLPMQPPISAPNTSAFSRPSVPPGFSAPRMNYNGPPPQHPLNMLQGNQQQVHRMPSGFPPQMQMMHGLPGPPHPHPNYPRNMPHNLPVALNNFAMHPNFNAMRPMVPPMMPPRLPVQPNVMQGMPSNSAVNQFNQRLVQEIQQNHPMLANNRGMNHGFNNSNHLHNSQHMGYHNLKNHGKLNMRLNGNVEEYDEYSNLMSARDKHWLIGIQLSQLNTETPYIDDYYYTVLKERRAKLRGDSQSKAHKDNQLNHPLIQPKGHAQLVLISMGKNGANNRNGQNRERKNSESKNDNKEQIIRTHTPLQFENSLGKLQYGSVTAPRKIIDMDVMGNEGNPQFNTTIELSAQRKSRQLLLNIETAYRIVLKLEDLENPAAIATFAVVRERKEKERQQKLEQAMLDAATRSASEYTDKADSAGNSVNSSFSEKNEYEIESRDKLLQKLMPLLTADKISAMMNVRKGKALVRRILRFVEDNPVRWNVWCGVFISLQTVLKKDKDDEGGLLFALYPQFKKQIAHADLDEVVKIANSMPLNDKRVNILFACKFCISSLVALLLRAEEIYSIAAAGAAASNQNNTSAIASNKEWPQFLSTLSTSLSRTVQHQTISAAIESDAIQPMIRHFSRFDDLKLDSLVALFSQAKQQVGI